MDIPGSLSHVAGRYSSSPRLRICRIDGTDANVVSSISLRFKRLLQTVGRNANYSIRTQHAPCLRNRHILLSKMHPVRASFQHDVRIVIDNERHIIFFCQYPQGMCLLQHLITCSGFVAKLYNMSSSYKRLLHNIDHTPSGMISFRGNNI
ncbi:hypothetical protein D3C78_1486900 [compost metagenome]